MPPIPTTPAPWRRVFAAAALSLGIAGAAQAADEKPVTGGELIFSDVQLIYSWERQGAGRYNQGNVIGQFVDWLVHQTPEGRIVPWIASSFDVKDDAAERISPARFGSRTGTHRKGATLPT